MFDNVWVNIPQQTERMGELTQEFIGEMNRDLDRLKSVVRTCLTNRGRELARWSGMVSDGLLPVNCTARYSMSSEKPSGIRTVLTRRVVDSDMAAACHSVAQLLRTV